MLVRLIPDLSKFIVNQDPKLIDEHELQMQNHLHSISVLPRHV